MYVKLSAHGGVCGKEQHYGVSIQWYDKTGENVKEEKARKICIVRALLKGETKASKKSWLDQLFLILLICVHFLSCISAYWYRYQYQDATLCQQKVRSQKCLVIRIYLKHQSDVRGQVGASSANNQFIPSYLLIHQVKQRA